MSVQPPTKRPRSSSPQPTELRDTRYYHEDGNIVLSAPEDPSTPSPVTYFRVHKSVLAKASKVFNDMFQLPAPSSMEEDMFDDTQLVVLHDRAMHLKGFLWVLYDPAPLLFLRFQDATPDRLTGALLLAKKYEATHMQTLILRFLQAEWPANDYSEWKYRRSCLDGPKYRVVNPERLIRLSWTAGVREELSASLAMAYYELSSYGPEDYLQELLSKEDCFIIMSGRMRMLEWFLKTLKDNNAIDHQLAICLNCKQQQSLKSELMDATILDGGQHLLTFLEDKASILVTNAMLGTSCQVCRSGNIEWLRGIAAQLYVEIPGFFMPVASPA